MLCPVQSLLCCELYPLGKQLPTADNDKTDTILIQDLPSHDDDSDEEKSIRLAK